MLRKINKKAGSPPIVILAILVFLIYFATLFSFIRSSGKIVAEIESPFIVMNSLYSAEGDLRLHLSEIGQEALIKTYIEFTKNGEYAYVGDATFIDKIVFFGELKSDLNKDFGNRFAENVNTKVNTFSFDDESSLKGVKGYSKTGSFDGNTSFLVVKGFSKDVSFFKKLSIKYSPEITLSYNLNNYGLQPFDRVYEVKETCKKLVDGFGDCFEFGLPNFKAVYSKITINNKEENYIILTSKRSFLIDGELQKVSFSFLF